MRKVLLYGLVVVVAAWASDAFAASLDHFKCYPAQSDTEIDAAVQLRDQFGSERARVLATALFCNPATKLYRDEVTKIGNPDAHLQLYKIRTGGEPERRRVLVSNQLGRSQRLAVGPAVLLAVPTQKLEHRSELPPRGLDHFQCYEAEGEPVGAPLALRDQLGFERDLEAAQPRLLCNPVEKRHGERVSKIRNPDEHLVCYDLEGTERGGSATTRNQLGTDKLRLRPAELLCVPSRKRLEEDRPAPGEDVERRLDEGARAEAALATLQCGSPTGDYAVTGSESQVSGDEHCFPSNGAGGFGPRADVHELAIVDGMDVADMDGDGDDDFLACDGLSGEVALYTQGPPGVFTPAVVANNVTTGVGGSVFCTNLRVADFNGDGARDFVVGDNRVTNGTFVYLQGPPGTFARVAPGLDVGWASPSGAQCNCLFGLAAGDVDGDANPDVLLLGYRGAGSGEVRFYRGDGLGGMDPPVLKFNLSADFPVVDAPTGIALLDVDQDGDLDLVAGGAADGSHYVYTNDGAGNFAPPGGAAFSIDNYSGLDAYDFDSDGDDDLALVDWTGLHLLYAEGLGGGALAAPAPVGNLRGPSIGVGAPELRVRPPRANLDHFKCYPVVEPVPADAEVALRDQFGGGRAKVLEDDHFCTPTAKVHEGQFTPIRNDDNHLAFYRLEAETTAPQRPVQVSNQFFRQQTLEVGRPVYLAAPARKLEPKFHRPPRGLDHFQCYEARGETAGAEVRLRDQFGEEGSVVLEPRLLCNPVQKRHEETVTEVRNLEDHLVCYGLRRTEVTASAQWRTQFGENASPLRPADLLCVPSSKRDPNQDPNITQMCGDRDAVDFDGGMVPPGDPGTGLLAENPDATWPDGRPRRPCGEYVPVDGFLPGGGVTRFRVAFREHTQPVPPLGTAPGIHTRWFLRDRSASPFCMVNPANVLETSGPLAWMDASDYLQAKNGGLLTDFCPNSGLRLAVWDSAGNMGLGPPDPDGHYVLWLEWEDGGGVLHKEPFEHHLQLDNELPTLTDLLVTLQDGTTALGACGEAPEGEHLFRVSAEFSDDFYWGYRIVVRGGDPPATVGYGWHDYHDGTPEVANTDRTGTTPSGSNQFLRNVDMLDFGASFTDCCYLLELFVRDAAIRHSFNNRVANETTGGYWDDVSAFFTFSAAP